MITSIYTSINSRREETCVLRTYYAAYNVKSVPTFRENLSVPSLRAKKSRIFLDFLTLEDGTGKFSRNVGIELPPCAAKYERKAQVS